MAKKIEKIKTRVYTEFGVIDSDKKKLDKIVRDIFNDESLSNDDLKFISKKLSKQVKEIT